MAGRPRLLICPPTFYTVAYEINPWMNLLRRPDRALARSQWRTLRSLLSGLAELVEIAPVPGAPDMVFTANAGLVHPRGVIVSRFRHPQRRLEEPHFRRWCRRRDLALIDWPADVCFEGAGDALYQPDGGRVWFGHGIRSALEALPHLRRLFAEEIVPLRLVSPSFYHLDTCLCPLPGGAVMYYPDAFDAESRLRLYRRVAPALRIEVGAEDAHSFACNALVLGTTVVLNRASAALREGLARLGLEVLECDVGEFIRAGGAVRCLTLRLSP